MEIKNTKFLNIFNKIKSINFVYLSITIFFFILVIILFFISTGFIMKNINNIFSSTRDENSKTLNMENYSLVVKKLNLPINNLENTNTSLETQTTPSDTATADASAPATVITSIPETVAPVAPVIDKKSITINILNSTSKKGVASILAKALEDAGFSTATTGNEKKSYDLTTINIVDSKKEYSSYIEETVKKYYPNATTKIITDKTEFDVTIIIGKI